MASAWGSSWSTAWGSSWGAVGAAVAAVTAGGEGQARRRKRYPRRVYYRGIVRTLRNAAEERAFLQMLADEARVLAAVADTPQTIAVARRAQVRIAARIAKVDDRAAQWLETLRNEDEEILAAIQ